MADKADKREDNSATLIKDAQYRKGLSIAFFNSVNAAIEWCKATGNMTIENFEMTRDRFVAQHAEYYANVIAQVGGNYDPKKTIAKLKSAKTVDALKAMWIGLSEDERQDAVIKKLTFDLKDKLTITKTDETQTNG